MNLRGSFIMGELLKLPNIGKEIESQLNKVGIFTYDELKDIGAEQAWLKIQEIDISACIHRLLALEGAIHGVKKTALSLERKAELKHFYNWYKVK
jgi:DNA transformation protein